MYSFWWFLHSLNKRLQGVNYTCLPVDEGSIDIKGQSLIIFEVEHEVQSVSMEITWSDHLVAWSEMWDVGDKYTREAPKSKQHIGRMLIIKAHPSILRTYHRFFSSTFIMHTKQKTSAFARAEDFVDFVNASPTREWLVRRSWNYLSCGDSFLTAFHAVHSSIQKLKLVGFEEIRERDSWSSTLKPGGKYYLTRNGSSIVAFSIGKKWKPGNPIAMIGAHTDSPCLRLKPVSKKLGAGFMQVGVETVSDIIARANRAWFVDFKHHLWSIFTQKTLSQPLFNSQRQYWLGDLVVWRGDMAYLVR